MIKENLKLRSFKKTTIIKILHIKIQNLRVTFKTVIRRKFSLKKSEGRNHKEKTPMN